MTRIAIVDHDAELSRLLGELFALEGYESVTYPPAAVTPDAVVAADADLILFDGWSNESHTDVVLLRALRRDPRTAGTPVVLCSGDEKALETNGAWLRDAEISTIVKPFELEELFDVIEGRLRVPHGLSAVGQPIGHRGD